MSQTVLRLILPLLVLLISVETTAQPGNSTEDVPLAVLTKSKKKVSNSSSEKRGKKVTIYRHHKKLSAVYTGYVIELIQSELPLKRSTDVFQHFGKIYYDRLDDGSYSYCILADFDQKKARIAFMEEMVIPKIKTAQLIEYKRGIRKIK